MYAIIQASGRQVRVEPGGFANVDHLGQAAGAEVTFDRVLLIEKDGGEILAGSPFIADARVVAVVVDGELRGPKIRVFKMKRRKGFRKTRGHRAALTRVRVKDILV